jgi:hypothetical protein
MKNRFILKATQCILAATMLLMATEKASAATGEMGTGVPISYGNYSAVLGGYTAIWVLGTGTINFPAGCNFLLLVRATMGADDYKIAQATLLTARITNKKVRFYAHAERDGGCGVDYVQMLD